ncbi:TPA: hypothetical protein R4193_001463 [Serratia marcescens]|uniref:hypothetical protein n=1 Tax=Serratia TaxID=613 RepID=UPI000744DB87|nr:MULTISPECIES: hypothetical protein [Serratia]EGT0504634.1 hypothetical protein [Serratia marcescens]EHT9830693.1 hypothetical protein [Serratia marcescens]EIU0971823.1 hypothetical protein [Serratia marcescens]EMB7752983.1 hypothetical protein [Serratia marcescens]MDP8629339.1 hypothetical protein [Serratia marcescens]
MSNNANAQAQLDNLRNVASQLKEMRHYAQANTETLSAHWLAFDQGECKNKAFAEAINDLLNKQGACLEGLEKTTQDIEIELNRLDKAA